MNKKQTLKPISEGDDAASENAENSVEGMSLDQLFLQLAKETKASGNTVDDNTNNEFDKIQKEVLSLPKINCELELKSDPKAKLKQVKPFVVNINDPITITRKTKEEPTDAGAKWFHMRKPEMTTLLKRDLLVLKNRSVLDPKRHYKKEKWEIPKYFETGTIIEGNTEFYSARMARKDRGKTLADEILQDSAANTYFKRKYAEIQKKNVSGKKGHYKKIKAKRHGH